MLEKAPLSILLIEDNSLFVEILQKLLEEYHLVTAYTAAEGLARFKEYKPEVVLLDIRLPDMNGYEVLLQLKAIAPEAYVVMVTGSRAEEDIQKALDGGANGYIMKPFSKERIKQCIEEYLKLVGK